MFKKNKKYTYKEIEEIFEKARMEIIKKPFGNNQNEANEELNSQAQLTVMMMAISMTEDLKKLLFEKEED